ncbi:hypothetical protein [Nocardia amamiensis]|nr:hypothetical protein [Nocardia amamiensis]
MTAQSEAIPDRAAVVIDPLGAHRVSAMIDVTRPITGEAPP